VAGALEKEMETLGERERDKECVGERVRLGETLPVAALEVA